MKENDFNKLMASIKEAGQIKTGKAAPSRITEIQPPEIQEIRKKLHLSQQEFALMIGGSPRTLQNWEQGRRTPEGPASALLKVAAANPQAVLSALHQ